MLLYSFFHFICRDTSLPYEGLLVCLLVFINFALVVSDNKLRHVEIPHRVRILLEQLEGIMHNLRYLSEESNKKYTTFLIKR